MLVDNDYDLNVNYWSNDIIGYDPKTAFVFGSDTNLNYMTRYNNTTLT